MKIAILAWGSLIWEKENKKGDRLDLVTDDWKLGSPKLRIEFSRVSCSRDGALTLVIDPVNGAENPTFFAESRHLSREKAIHNLARREGTTEENIGYVDRRISQGYSGRLCTVSKDYSKEICDKIRDWAKKSNFDAVIWTALLSNFDDEDKAHKARYLDKDQTRSLNLDVPNMKFTVDNALKYLHGLKASGAAEARKYIKNALREVETALSKRMHDDLWLDK